MSAHFWSFQHLEIKSKTLGYGCYFDFICWHNQKIWVSDAALHQAQASLILPVRKRECSSYVFLSLYVSVCTCMCACMVCEREAYLEQTCTFDVSSILKAGASESTGSSITHTQVAFLFWEIWDTHTHTHPFLYVNFRKYSYGKPHMVLMISGHVLQV